MSRKRTRRGGADPLIEELRGVTARVAEDVRRRIDGDVGAARRARALYAEEAPGDAFSAWADLLARRAAALFVLKSFYVRVLEDRGLLRPARLAGGDWQALFARLAPALGDAAYLRWVFRDLARPGGLPELFAETPAEVVWPGEPAAAAVLEFWRTPDADAQRGGLRFRFDGERFDSRVIGDLYQELDPEVKSRYALLQTPGFVERFILDRTLEPALAQWPLEEVRVLDPACGSGHFLLGAFSRLAARWRQARPDLDGLEVARRVLGQVVGFDLNEYACALSRLRLYLAALDLVDGATLADLSALVPRVYCLDSLVPYERLAAGVPEWEGRQADLLEEAGEARDEAGGRGASVLGPADVAEAVRPLLERRFHVVVGNPPYITPKDKARNERYRGWYRSAYRQYSLAAPFTQRFFELAVPGGYVGMINANSFMKREFGRPLVEEVLPRLDLLQVVDTSGAYIPGHGTPTVILIGRNRPPEGDRVRVVMGRRGEPETPEDPERGEVWGRIAGHADDEEHEDAFISVGSVAREVLGRHPWSLGGGGAAGLRQALETLAPATLAQRMSDIGRTAHTGEDGVFVHPRGTRCPAAGVAPLVIGERVRDWGIAEPDAVSFPYDGSQRPELPAGASGQYWRYRTTLRARQDYGQTVEERGMEWFEYSMFFPGRFAGPGIAFAFVATHNHFVLDRGGKVFNRSAPVIKLPEGATEDDHLLLLGLLNSSTACFWMKQVFHDKGSGTDKGKWQDDPAKIAYEFAATGLLAFPVPALDPDRRAALVALARRADTLAQERSGLIDRALPTDLPQDIRTAAAVRSRLGEAEQQDGALLGRLIAAQEELDWLCMAAYGLVDDTSDAGALSLAHGVRLGERPFEVLSARGGATAGTDGQPLSADLAEAWPEATRAAWERRIALIEAVPAVALVEAPEYKRRWVLTPKSTGGRVLTFRERLDERVRTWLLDAAERAAEQAGRPCTCRDLAARLDADPRVHAVAEVCAGRTDFDLQALLEPLVDGEAVPGNKHHRYKPSGLAKRAEWERTWELQRREDAGERVEVPVPPKYGSGDFRKGSFWKLRGKLDVPKERFVAFSEAPGEDGAVRYGWAGWTAAQRAKALVDLLEEATDCEGQGLADTCGILQGIWSLLPELERDAAGGGGEAGLAAEYRDLAVGFCNQAACPCPVLDDWRAAHGDPPRAGRKPGRRPR